jgi:CheY-like chemotaxis protein
MDVLIASDNDLTLNMLTAALENMKYTVISARNGQDAWDIYRSGSFFQDQRNRQRYGARTESLYNIIKKHQGVIDVRSQPGMGAEFTNRIPIIGPAPP